MAGHPMIVRGVSALACLAGCNQLFGLEAAEQRPDDAGPAPDAVDAAPGACDNPGGPPDEDGDGLRNACDNCPHIAQTAGQRGDSDGDGVGNRCDPREGRPDVLVAFHDFESTPPGYQPISPSGVGWSIAGGRLNVVNGTTGTDYLARFAANLRTAAIATQVTITGVPTVEPLPASHRVGVWVNIDPAGDQALPPGLVYQLAEDVPMGASSVRFTQLVDTTPQTGSGMASGSNQQMWVVQRPYQLTLSCDGTMGTCRGTASYDNAQAADAMLDPLNMRDGAVGLRVYGASATFDYVAIYGEQP